MPKSMLNNISMLTVGTYTSCYRYLNDYSKVKVKQSLYRPAVFSRVPGSESSHIS